LSSKQRIKARPGISIILGTARKTPTTIVLLKNFLFFIFFIESLRGLWIAVSGERFEEVKEEDKRIAAIGRLKKKTKNCCHGIWKKMKRLKKTF
jgi:hypothetical protein